MLLNQMVFWVVSCEHKYMTVSEGCVAYRYDSLE